MARSRIFRCSSLAVAAATAAFVTGCAVGPDYHRPAAPAVQGYPPAPLTQTVTATNTPGGAAQNFLAGADLAGDWWTLFQSPPLNALIERSLKANPNLQAAQAALRAARENVRAQRGAYYPAVTAGFGAQRDKSSAAIAPTPNSNALQYDLFTPQVAVAYSPDVFGLNRRTVESLQAQQEQARFALVAADITLTANVVAAAIQAASLRAQVAATQKLIAVNTNLLQVLRQQFARGYAGRLDVAAQESQLAQVRATLPPLLKQLAQQRDLIAALAGGYPSDPPAEEFELAGLQLPSDLPVSLPAQLVAQRPDVRLAEENLHALSALVGVSVANRLPNLMLTADVGSMALAAGQMFANGNGFWGIAGNVTQPVFQGGTLRHRERAARAAVEEAAQQYRAAVLTAFQNVADTLAALEQDAAGLQAAAAAQAAAEVAFNLARQQWQAGYSSYLVLLNAEQAYNQAAINLIQAQANRYTDTAALFQALGGGWWHRPEYTKR